MKKLLFILILVFSWIGGVLAQNDAMYIYENDGNIEAFLKADIDSIRHSHLDIDSVYHKETVVQEVWTADSVYRIPLSVIDSVSFVTPAPVYQEGVQVFSDDLTDYVLSYTDTAIVFRSQIPRHLLPAVGQIVVSDAYEEPFPTGFSGRMREEKQYVDSIVCLFDPVCLDDVYSKLLLVGSYMNYDEVEEEARHSRQFFDNSESQCISLPGSISIGAGGLSAKLEKPSLRIDYLVCLGEENLRNVVKIKARFKSSGSLGIEIKADTTIGKEPHWGTLIPIKVGVIAGSIEFGWFSQFSGSLSIQASFPFDVSYSGGFTYTDNSGIVSDTPSNEFRWDEPEWNASINGSLFAGVASRLSIALLHTKVACIDLVGKFGVEVSSSYDLASEEGFNTTLYENLKDVEVQSALKLDLQPGYRVWFCDRKDFIGANLTFKFLEKTEPLLPEISELYWNRHSSTSGELGGKVEKDVFMKSMLGWALYQGEEYKLSKYLPGYYWKQNNWTNNGLQTQLSDLPQNLDKAYPVVRLFNKDVLVPECVNLKTIPVEITNFEQTGAYYSEGAYVNDGIAYDYKYEVAVTVEINSLEGIEEWGYVYEDPNGNLMRIPLTQFGNSITDTRYAYYRNEATSSVCLYSYVKYNGDIEYSYGDPVFYPLEYKKEQIMEAVDLGLPSGLKWATCNVGASSPEDYGDYFAWGETEPKTTYDWSTYKWCRGSSYSMTKYCINSKYGTVDNKFWLDPEDDAAHVNWGGSWRMPNSVEQSELRALCHWTWTSQNGVVGYKVTGPNGNSIFLPVTGYRCYDDFFDVGSSGYSWSDQLSEKYGYSAIYMSFGKRGYGWNGMSRCCGLSVRPVCE